MHDLSTGSAFKQLVGEILVILVFILFVVEQTMFAFISMGEHAGIGQLLRHIPFLEPGLPL
jgi:hypothetical protein